MGSNGYGIFVGDHSMRTHKEGECEHGTYVVVILLVFKLNSSLKSNSNTHAVVDIYI